MELKEFISNTLTQMADGVREAIKESEGKGYWVNPSTQMYGSKCKVHFDLSVESDQKEAASIKVLGASMSERSVNRISFDINIALPTSGNTDGPTRPVYEDS